MSLPSFGSSSDELRLLSSRRSRLSETFLELFVGGLEDEQNEIDVRPRIVSAIVPAARTQFERLVVAILIRLDKAFEADVPPDVVAQTVGLQEPQQARDAAVSVAERVNAEKVEVRRGKADERMYPTLRHAAGPR